MAWLCARLGVSRSGFYAWEKRTIHPVNTNDKQLLSDIKRVHTGRRRCYGSPRVYQALKREGITCSRRRVARVMRENGVKASVVGLYKHRPKQYEVYRRIDNHLAKAKQPSHSNQQWVADFTYLKTRSGQWVYLATIMDLFSRKIIGWSISSVRNTDLTKSSLKMALDTRRPLPGALFHTDQGVEYAAERFQSALETARLKASMSRKGRCLDNATAESFFHTFKTESFYQQRFKNLAEIEKEFVDYIDFYNNQRLHSSLNYQSPTEYEQCFA